MNKNKLYDYLMQNKLSQINSLKGEIKTIHSMVDIDESDTIDPEDYSHQNEKGDQEHLLLKQLNRLSNELTELQQIDFSDKSICEIGAIVTTENFNFILGYGIMPFDFESIKMVGVSADSPFYQAIKGKKAGDEFSHLENHYKILEIN